jgi:hypothetical protein
MKSTALTALLLFVAALVDCSGGTSSSNPSLPCLPPAAPQLIYPAPGATGVPDGNFTMVLTYFQGVTLNGGASVEGPFSQAALPSPLPTPYASPLPSGYPLAGYVVGALAPATTYTVTETSTGTGACAGVVLTGGSSRPDSL